MKCEVLDTGCASAERNMELDQHLLDSLKQEQRFILHLYDWSAGSATYGYFAKPLNFIKPGFLQIARRPTGGGIIFHLWDFAFSVLVPATHPFFTVNTLENYAFINRIVSKAIQQFSGQVPQLLNTEPQPENDMCGCFCMAKPTQYDIMINGRKVGGGGQRRTRYGYLHQGTISLVAPDIDVLKKVLLPQTNILESMQKNTHALLAENSDIPAAKHKLCEHLIDVFKEMDSTN